MSQNEQVESVFDGICNEPVDYTIGLVKGYKRSKELIPKLKQVVEWYENEGQAKINNAPVKAKEQILSAEDLSEEVKKLSGHTRLSILREALNKRYTKAEIYFRLSVVLGDFEQIKKESNYKAQYIKSYKQRVSYNINVLNSGKTIPDELIEKVHSNSILVYELINNQNFQYLPTERMLNIQNQELNRSMVKKLRSSKVELERKRKKRMFLIDDDIEYLKERIAKHPLSEETERNTRQHKNDSIRIFRREKRMIEEAARYGAIKCFKFLLMNGTKVSEKTLESGFVPGNLEIIQLVREKGIGYTERCLKIGIKYHHNELVEQLIEEGCIEKINMKAIIEEAHKHNNLSLIMFLKTKGLLNEYFYQNIRNGQQYDIPVRAPIAHYIYETFKSTCLLSDQIQLIQDDDPLYSSFLSQNATLNDYIIMNDSVELFIALLPYKSNLVDYSSIIQNHSVKILQYQRDHDSSFAANISSILNTRQSLFNNHRDSAAIEILLNAGVDERKLFIEAAKAESTKPLAFLLIIPKARESAPDDLLVRAVKHHKLIDKMIDMGFETKGAFREAVKSLNISSVERLVARKLIDFDEFDSLTFIQLINDESMVRYLISIGWDINRPDQEGKTFLLRSLEFKMRVNISFIQFLLKNNADIHAVDENGNSPLHLAIKSYDIRMKDVTKLLIDEGADINAIDKNGNSPLHLAIQIVGMDDIAQLLIEKGADVNAIDKNGNSPLHLATKSYDLRMKDIAILLIDKGANIKATDRDGNTPLHLAIKVIGMNDVAKLLIEKGADINVIDKNGNNPLHLAIKSYDMGMKDVAKLLIDKGIDINATDRDGNTPLHLAIKMIGMNDVAKLLIEKGADINAVDSNGNTPLRLAISSYDIGMKEVAMVLIDKGANMNAIDNEEDSSLKLAINNRQDDIVKHLIKKGTNTIKKSSMKSK